MQIQQQKNNLNEMKIVAFCACVLAFACFSSAEIASVRLKQALSHEDNFEDCMTENNMTAQDWWTGPEIINGEYTEPGNEERRRKSGCTMECLLKKEGWMEGSDIKENKIYSDINKHMKDDPMLGRAHKIAHDCIREGRNITQECEKGFSLFVCVVKADNKVSEHGEHENE